MNYSGIYLRTTASLEEVAELVRRETGVTLARAEVDGEVFFEGLDGDRRVAVYVNEWREPEYDPLGEYDFEVNVDGYDDHARVSYARAVFDKLARLGSLPLLLVDEFVVLDRFEITAGAEADS
jgi:hypothetical protein